jgi:hypothetical protein
LSFPFLHGAKVGKGEGFHAKAREVSRKGAKEAQRREGMAFGKKPLIFLFNLRLCASFAPLREIIAPYLCRA